VAFKPPEGLPKISGLTRALTTPEVQFERVVKEATKVELPTGPLSILTRMQESLEAGKTPELPETPGLEGVLARLPELPKFPSLAIPGKAEEKTTLLEEKEVKVRGSRVIL